MFRKRRWLIVGGLVLAQVGVIACYQGFLRGSSDAAALGCCAAEKPQAAQPSQPARVAQATPPSEPGRLPDVLPPAADPTPPPVAMPAQPTVEAEPPAPAGALPPSPAQLPEPPVIPAAAAEPPAPAPAVPPSPVSPPLPPQPEVSTPLPPPPPAVGPPPGGEPTPAAPLPPSADAPPSPQPLPPVAAQPQPQAEPPLPPGPCPWTLKMTIVDGITVMEARVGKEIQFRILCDKLDLQTPRGAIHAQGDVKISGSGLDGHCDRLLINWHVDQIVVEGNAYLKCLREGHDVELTADRLSLRLSESSTVKGVGRRKDVPAEEPVEFHEKGPALKSPTKPPMPVRAE